MEKGVVLELLESLPHLLKLDSELTEEGVLMRYRGDQLVGVTILNARKRLRSQT